ncbi:DNA-processing protein DprA [Vibrio sp. RC27]
MSDPTKELSREELMLWLRLSALPRVGIQHMLKLLSRYSLLEMMAFSHSQWANVGLTEKQLSMLFDKSIAQAEASLAWLDESSTHRIIAYCDPLYPPLLKEINSAPSTLYTIGDANLLSKPQLSIVGSRHASRVGSQTAQQFSADFSRQGLVVTSGLALGIDGQAHIGALNADNPTIAVLAAGFRHLYPRQHISLASRITEKGVLVTEFAPDIRARPEYFPRRNRIISGLSTGVLVVEAAEKSGSLVTAKYAAEQGRDVFVVPGSIHQANCRGSNELIRQGAILVQTSEQVIQEIGNILNWAQEQDKNSQGELFPVINTQEELPFPELLANVGKEVTPIDIIAERTNIPIQEAMVQLLELELNGHIESIAGGYILKGRG